MINDFFTFIQAKEEKKNEENIGNFLLLHRIYSKKMLMLVGMKMENFFFFLFFFSAMNLSPRQSYVIEEIMYELYKNDIILVLAYGIRISVENVA